MTLPVRTAIRKVAWTPQEYGRAQATAAEAVLLQQPQIEIPLRHFFSPGVYAREMTVPAGVVLTGKIHKYAQLNILSKGEVSVLLEDGVKRIKAPFTIVAPAGAKRVFYAHEESVWTVILATEETDVEKIEGQFTAATETEYQQFLENKEGAFKCLSS